MIFGQRRAEIVERVRWYQGNRPRRAVALLSAFAMVAAGAGVHDTRADERIPLIRIDVSERAPARVGAELGRAYTNAFPELERRWDGWLHQAFAAAGGDPQDRFNQLLKTRIDPLRADGVGKAARAEVEGMGSAWSLVGGNRLGDGALSHDEFWAAQLLADLGLTGGGVGYAVFGDASAGDGSIVGRNRDALLSDACEPPLAITVRSDGRRHWALIGFAGQVAPLTGMNDRGLFVTHVPVPSSSRIDLPEAPRAIGFALRQALERQARVAAAASSIASQRFAEGQALLIADPEQAAVLEQAAGAPGRLRTDTSPTRPDLVWERADQVAAVDCLALASQRGDCRQLRDRYRWQRLHSLARFGADGPRARPDDVAAMLLDTANPPYPIFAPSTREVLIYQPSEDALYLRTFAPGTWSAEDAFGSKDQRASASILPLYRPLRMGADASASGIGLGLLLIWGVLGLLAVALIVIRLRLRLRIDPGDES